MTVLQRPNILAQHHTSQRPNAVIDGLIGVDVADYGGSFTNYTTPTPLTTTEIRYAEDTNTTTPGKRLYIYANGKWSYVALT